MRVGGQQPQIPPEHMAQIMEQESFLEKISIGVFFASIAIIKSGRYIIIYYYYIY